MVVIFGNAPAKLAVLCANWLENITFVAKASSHVWRGALDS
jgi:hypothetical protein